MSVELDNLDRRILLELDKNSRQSFSQLAKKLGTAKSVVNYRIKQMEHNNIIRGYYTVVDTGRLGFHSFRVYIKLKEADKKKKEAILQHLIHSKRTWWVATTTFPYDIAVIFLARNLHEFKSIVDNFLKAFKESIDKCEVNEYVELRHFFREYIASDDYIDKRQFMAFGEEDKADLSEQDFAILKELSLNSRLGTVSMAKKLKLSPITIKNAIKKMLKIGVIRGFRVLINYPILNYGYYWVHINVNSFDSLNKLREFVTMFPETVYLDETIGGDDIEFGVQVKEDKGIQKLLMEIFNRYEGSITEYKYFKVLENKKVSYLPQD